MSDIVDAIQAAAPEVTCRITWTGGQLPFPGSLECGLLERLVGPLPRTSLRDGVRQTIERYRAP